MFVFEKSKIRIKVLLRRLQQCLGPANTLNWEWCSKTEAYGHSNNLIFSSQELLKYLSYEADLRLQNVQNFV